MKQIFCTIIVTLLVTTAGFAQGFYFRGGLGYAFAQAGQTIDGTSTPYNGTSNNATFQETFSIKGASFSSGFQGALGFGYMFSEHVGIQLDASVGISSTKYTFTDNNISYAGYQSNESTIQQANTPFLLMPALVLQTGGESAWSIYSRFGLALPVNTKITVDNIYYIPSQAETDDYTSDLKSSFSLGFTAAAGLQYKVNDRTTIWGEVTLLSMSLFTKEANLKSVTANGYSIPLDSVGGPHTVKYSKNVTVDTNYANQPAYSQPFSNVGVSVGIKINLSGSNSRHSGKHSKDEDLIDRPKRSRFQ